jgi:hypothetical protein
MRREEILLQNCYLFGGPLKVIFFDDEEETGGDWAGVLPW